MKKMFLLCFLNVFLIGCSQSEKKSAIKEAYDVNQYVAPEAKDITEANFVEKLASNIIHYNSEPIYYFRINKQNCLLEVYINDVRNYKDYGLSNVITPTEIGHILKSGQQTVTVKMYPVGDLINKDLGLENQPPATKLSDKAKVDISVVMMDNKSAKGFADEKLIVEKLSPKEAAGKDFYEFSFTFEAKVPYEFEGWTKGQDLRKLNQDLVRKKAREFYEMIGKLYLNKDLTNILKIDYPSTLRIKSSYYKNKEDLIKSLEEYKREATKYNYIMRLDNFKMEYMGDGKLLRLVQSSLDLDHRGKGALMLEYDEGYYFPGITLYLPEGRDLATQGFMMWK